MHITKSLFMKYVPHSFPAVYSANTSRLMHDDLRVCARQLNKYFAIADNDNFDPPVQYVDNIEITVTTEKPEGKDIDWLRVNSKYNWEYVRTGVGTFFDLEIMLDPARDWIRDNFPGRKILYVWVTVPNS